MSIWHRCWVVFGLLALLFLVAACAATEGQPPPQGDATHGGELWAASPCLACHGLDAAGTQQGPALAYTPLSLRDVINITRRGTPGMPAYPAAQIGDAALEDMYAWFQNPVAEVTSEPQQDPWVRSGCGGCHGAGAGGGTAPALTGQEPYDAFQRVVRQGRDGMPAYDQSQLTDADLRWIYDWIQAQTQTQTQTPAPAPARTQSQTPTPVQVDPQALWTQTGCGRCHGADAGGGRAPALAGRVPPYDEFQRAVRRGPGGMPAYSEGQISDAELQRLHDWLQAGAGAGSEPAAGPTADPGATAAAAWAEAGCGACHGAQAEGASAVALAGLAIPYDEFERTVRQGARGMPAFSAGQIDDQVLQRLYDWLRAGP